MQQIQFMRDGNLLMQVQAPADNYKIDDEILSAMKRDNGSHAELSEEERRETIFLMTSAAIVNSFKPLQVGDEIWADDELAGSITHVMLLKIRAFNIQNNYMALSDGLKSANFSISKIDKTEYREALIRDFIDAFISLDDEKQKIQMQKLRRDVRDIILSHMHVSDPVDQEDFEAWKKEIMELPEPLADQK